MFDPKKEPLKYSIQKAISIKSAGQNTLKQREDQAFFD